MVSKKAIAVCVVGGFSAVGGYYFFTRYLPAHSITSTPIGTPKILLSLVDNVIYIDEVGRIKVTYTSTSRPELTWASDWYPVSKIDKLFWAIDVKYPPAGTVAQATMNKMLKARVDTALGMMEG